MSTPIYIGILTAVQLRLSVTTPRCKPRWRSLAGRSGCWAITAVNSLLSSGSSRRVVPMADRLQMFNRETGEVDPKVVAYWRDHYDLAHIVASDWARRGPNLKGKIHVFVGTADTFYLDGPAHKFEAVLKSLNADPHFTYIDNRTHFDLYKIGDDRQGLFDTIAAQMYAVARPGQQWKSR